MSSGVELERNKIYPFQLWIITIFLGSLLIPVTNSYYNVLNLISLDTIGFLIFVLTISLLYSLPTFVVVIAVFHFVQRRVHSVIVLKLILLLITLAGVWLSFFLLFGRKLDVDNNFQMWAINYSVAALMATVVLRVK